jgi:hypothetical protein
MSKDQRFWVKESRIWTADCLKLIGLGDYPVTNAPHHIPQTEAGIYAMYAASDAFKARPELRG